MALVWFVDKFPRSRKPVLYRRLEDFVGSADLSGNDLLPVLLPCALCCSQQQMSASVVAHQLHQQKSKSLQRRSRIEKATEVTGRTQSQRSRSLPQKLENYNEFLQLCQHVECMVEKSMERIIKNDDDNNQGVTSDTKKMVDDDDMMLRSLRDANRSPAPLMKQMVHPQTNKNHYVWKEPEAQYKSQFFPMRNHDLVRDDLAVRRLIKPSSTPTLDRRPPPHPNHKSNSSRPPRGKKVPRSKSK